MPARLQRVPHRHETGCKTTKPKKPVSAVNDKVGRNDFLTLKSDSVNTAQLSDFKPTQSPTADSQRKFQTDSPTQSPTTDSAYKTEPTH